MTVGPQDAGHGSQSAPEAVIARGGIAKLTETDQAPQS
jgi:hypothetical protein